MLSKRWLFVVGLVVALSNGSFGTSVLIIETDENVLYIAADSLQRDAQAGYTRQFCKISKLGNTYWAVATNFYVHRTTGFNVERLVASIGAQGTSEAMMQRLEVAATSPLAREVASLESEAPKEFAELVIGTAAGKRSPLEIAFVGTEKGKPTWAITRFFASRTKHGIVVTPERERRLAPPILTGLGDWEPAAIYVRDHMQQFYTDPTGQITKSIQAVAAANPSEVGGPVSILRLDASGAEWMSPGTCEPINAVQRLDETRTPPITETNALKQKTIVLIVVSVAVLAIIVVTLATLFR